MLEKYYQPELVEDKIYEEWEKAVYESPTGEYRVYIGLKMGVGDANRLAEYIVANSTKKILTNLEDKNMISGDCK